MSLRINLTEQREIISSFTKMAPRYESLMNRELNKFWGINYQDFVIRLLEDFSSDKNELILDIATGTTYIPSFILKRKMKLRGIIGLDLTFGMLWNGRKNQKDEKHEVQVPLVCGSANQMPFKDASFDQAICCLASHHMDVEALLANTFSILKPGGRLHIADAGASSQWKNIIVRNIIKIAAFIYFLFAENLSRAIAESAAIGNIHTPQQWKELMKSHGFADINIHNLKSKRFWTPDPIIIKAFKKPLERR